MSDQINIERRRSLIHSIFNCYKKAKIRQSITLSKSKNDQMEKYKEFWKMYALEVDFSKEIKDLNTLVLVPVKKESFHPSETYQIDISNSDFFYSYWFAFDFLFETLFLKFSLKLNSKYSLGFLHNTESWFLSNIKRVELFPDDLLIYEPIVDNQEELDELKKSMKEGETFDNKSLLEQKVKERSVKKITECLRTVWQIKSVSLYSEETALDMVESLVKSAESAINEE